MMWILGNLRLVAMIAAVLAVLAGIAYVYHRGGEAREDKIVAEAVEKEGEIQDEKDDIRNNRPDRDGVIVRLRAGTF